MTTILIVDDSMLARKMVAAAAAAARPTWTVVQASNGDEALEVVASRPPDYAIIDFNMPGMDGLTLAAALRERLPNLRSGILTANVQDALRRRANDMGLPFMDKPVNAEKLATLLGMLEAGA